MIQISLEVISSGTPFFNERILAPLIFFVALELNDFDAADEVNTYTFGPKGSGAIPLTNFATNDMFAYIQSNMP